MSNRYLEIAVSNKSSDGKMSFKNGISNLIFQLPAINGTLIPSSVRISGKIKFIMDDEGAVPSGVLSASSRLGVYGAFQSLTTRSIKHQQTIESIRHYAHFLSNYLPLTTSTDDVCENLSQTSLTLPNWSMYQEQVVQNNGGKDLDGNEFCLPLPCGLFNGTTDIPLNDTMLGGIEIVLGLASDSQMLFSSNGATGTINTAYYEFSDLKLCCEVRDYTPDELSRFMKSSGSNFTYQTISSYYDTINSAQANIWFNLGLSKVRSVFTSFIPSSYLNNRAEDGYATLIPSNTDGIQAAITKVSWQKGGSLYPKHFEMNNNIRDAANTLSCDPVLLNDYVSAVSQFRNNNDTRIGPANCNRGTMIVNSNLTQNQVQYTEVVNGGFTWGLGISYDQLGGSGSDFSVPGESWGLNIESELTTNRPHSVFIFVNSEINVGFNQNGIQVIQ